MQLVQLFHNLIENAIKNKSAENPRIHISAVTNDKQKWTFSVKDNGTGIDPQNFENFSRMFERLDKCQESSGTGIGLSICKKIVERHGGSFSVESQLGHGSTFQFELAGSERQF
jgi:two-component system, chemotaxis family, sensor kinase Cph1